ncbi:FCD domain-containing protein [Streptacidiphilus sp. ASG 303]|uniref:FadR/GntR family transcriptional regulator n=1 Tax=Streptacidiphilus sp. ASG 303 TaxID=2896847 RepID=UPI001E34294B|nr:FCD domain-containing protein [Streptacidiphilus sp. ASG 303]MCD0484458.1 FCD domain-containing protein [Streptacidiphilus sp. ASG 303]
MERLSGGAHLGVFAPVQNQARVGAVARRLGDAIELGLLADGEQLPGEADLAARLGVSTVTLRGALVALREQGLLETRRGRGGGSFVTAPSGPPAERLRTRLAEYGVEELRDLGDHHAAVSGAASLLAACRTDEDGLARLRRLEEEFAAAAGDAAALARADRRLHVEVAAAAQSPRLTREEIRFQTESGALLCLALSEDDLAGAAVRQHRSLLAAVEAGDGQGARALAEEHVRAAVDRLVDLRLHLPD